MQRLVAEKEKNPKNDLISDAIKQQVGVVITALQCSTAARVLILRSAKFVTHVVGTAYCTVCDAAVQCWQGDHFHHQCHSLTGCEYTVCCVTPESHVAWHSVSSVAS